MAHAERPPILRPEQVASISILLDQIHHRPGLYLGHPTVVGLKHFLDGLTYAQLGRHQPPPGQFVASPFDEFEAWVAARHNPEQMTIRSFSLALLRAGAREEAIQDYGQITPGQDRAAFDLWFAWYDEFRSGGRGDDGP